MDHSDDHSAHESFCTGIILHRDQWIILHIIILHISYVSVVSVCISITFLFFNQKMEI